MFSGVQGSDRQWAGARARGTIFTHLNVSAENWTGSQACTHMANIMTITAKSAAQEVLRVLLDLASADVRVTEDLLGRLLGLNPDQVRETLGHLRRAGLVQGDMLNVTMTGLAVGTSLPEVELAPMAPPQPRILAA